MPPFFRLLFACFECIEMKSWSPFPYLFSLNLFSSQFFILKQDIHIHFPFNILQQHSILLQFRFNCISISFLVEYYLTLFGYFQLFGIFAGPIVGCIFDKPLLKCFKKYDESETALLASPPQSHVAKMKESILPFVLTNVMTVALSLLSVLKWKPGLVSLIQISFF